MLVTVPNKLKGIKSILCFSGTPHFPIHSILPKIIISLVNQGLFKLCVNSGFTVSVSSNMSSKSCIRKWAQRMRGTCPRSSVCRHTQRLESAHPSLACSPSYGRSQQTGWLCFCLSRTGDMDKESGIQELLLLLAVELPRTHKCPHFSGRRMYSCSTFFFFPRFCNILM